MQVPCLAPSLWYPYQTRLRTLLNAFGQGCRTRLPKFKFSANFPIGLQVILQIQIKNKIKKCLISYVKYVLTENPLRFNLEVILNEFCLWITVRCMQRSRISGCFHIEFSSTYLLCFWLHELEAPSILQCVTDVDLWNKPPKTIQENYAMIAVVCHLMPRWHLPYWREENASKQAFVYDGNSGLNHAVRPTSYGICHRTCQTCHPSHYYSL